MKYEEAKKLARDLRKSQTKAEEYFWEKVRNRRLFGFKINRQFPVEYERDGFFIADFHCHEKKLIIELDGPIHKFQKEYDTNRMQILEELGFKVVRFENETVLNNWESVEKQLKEILSPNPSLQREARRGEL